MSEQQFTRAQEREPSTKAFAVRHDDLKGASQIEKYEKDDAFVQSREMHRACIMYAAAYSDTMLQRLENEVPDYFRDKGVSRTDMMASLMNNICLPITKAHGAQFRDTTARFKETAHTTDTIRRLNNGGDKFHPYL